MHIFNGFFVTQCLRPLGATDKFDSSDFLGAEHAGIACHVEICFLAALTRVPPNLQRERAAGVAHLVTPHFCVGCAPVVRALASFSFCACKGSAC